MTANRVSFRLLLPVALFAWGASGCEVNTCTGSKCEDLFPDGGLFGDMDGSMKGDAASGADASSSGDSGVGADGGQADGGGSGGDAGPALTLEELCTRTVSVGFAWAQLLDTCCGSTDRGSQEATSILGLFGYSDTAIDGCVQNNQALIDAGKVTFDGTHASTCADAFTAAYENPPNSCPMDGFSLNQLNATIGHGAALLAQIPACRETIVGSVQKDGQCTKDFECAAGLTCKVTSGGGAGAISTCQAPSTSGPCVDTGDCAYGYICVGSDSSGGRQCLPNTDLADQGGCSRTVECKVGKVCDVGGTDKCVAPPADTAICMQ